jgi:hypothetical protein
MVKIATEDGTYLIEFRHMSKHGKRARLRARAPVNALTVCSIVKVDKDNVAKFIASDASICSNHDNFSRLEGRLRALKKVLKYNLVFKDVRSVIWFLYQKETGVPLDLITGFDENALMVRFERDQVILGPEEIQRRIDAGQAIREERAQQRAESTSA